MEYNNTEDIRTAINNNIDNISSLMESAQKMQDSIIELQDESVKAKMIKNFNDVVDSINGLLATTKSLFDLLNKVMEE